MTAEPLQRPSDRFAVGLAWTPLAAAAGLAIVLLSLVLAHLSSLAVAAGGGVLALTVGVAATTWLLRRPRVGAPSVRGRGVGSAEAAAAARVIAPMTAVLDALEDPVLVVSGDEPDDLASRRLIYANAAAGELFRPTREAAPLVTAVRDPKVLEVVDEALFGRITSETLYFAGGAQDRVWRARARPLGEVQGRPLALLTLRDETELRRSERTRADFLANASHELRTPLASLTGFIETLRGHAKDDPAARDRFLGIMQDQAARMARLIEDLMSLSRIELNEHIPPQGRADLRLTVTDVLDALAPLAEEKCVRFETRLPAAPALVSPADRDQVVQVIQNLTENALKYAPTGSSVTLEVANGVSAADAAGQRQPGAAHLSLLTPDHAPDQSYVTLRISGGGPGMAREHLPRLTERFYRVEGQQRGGEKQGTGLGLAIVKHIMNRHRGGLTVESAPGEGAAFLVYFPAAPCAPQAAPVAEPMAQPGSP
ncbi:MAG TPA: ATP-binding protein [Caulobacteraceae bacterium]